MVDTEAKTPMYSDKDGYDYDHLDLSQLDLVIDVPNINKYSNEQYALLRKHGLGTSDSSALCGVNPYVKYADLIEEKTHNYLTQEELEVGNKTAVKKGRDLEPLIIDKFSKIMNKKIMKPCDMYHHKDYPWLKFNYDGVLDKLDMGDGRYQYIPSEIKVVTAYGIKHYDITKSWYRESIGFSNSPADHSKENNSIETKAAEYGIPPYYYTQLQQEIFGLNATFGYLTVLFDSTWEVASFMIYRDDACIDQILTSGYKAWNKICSIAHDPNRADLSDIDRVLTNKKQTSKIRVL